MNCDCSVPLNDCEAPSVHCVEWRTARKPHACAECGEPIPPGQRYEHVAGCWDGHWDTIRTCRVCAEVRERNCAHGSIYGQLWEQIEACHEEGR